MSKKETIKSSLIIHISHKLSLLQQQVWNVLLAYAYDNLTKQETHYLDIRILLSYVKTTRNIRHLKKVLSDLCHIESFTLIDKSKQRATKNKFNLLAYVAIENGVCKYSFSHDLLPQLVNPSSYAKINLVIQSTFTSKYSLIIYELCIDYLGAEQTPALTINDFKIYLGLESHEYAEFKHLNYKIIKKAIAEINQKSDILVMPKIITLNGNVAIRFAIKKKQCTIVNASKLVVKPKTSIALHATIDCPFKQLKAYGVSDKKSLEIVSLFDQQEIKNALHLLQQNIGKIINTSAWLVDLFNKKHSAKEQRMATIQKLDTGFDELKIKHNNYINNKAQEEFKQLSEDQKKSVDIAFEKWLAVQSFKFTFVGAAKFYRSIFLIQTLLDPHERNFKDWARINGYTDK